TRVVRTSPGPAGRAVMPDLVEATQATDGDVVTVTVAAPTPRLLVVDLWGGGAVATVNGAAPTAVTDEAGLLGCTAACVLVETGHARVATQGRELVAVFGGP